MLLLLLCVCVGGEGVQMYLELHFGCLFYLVVDEEDDYQILRRAAKQHWDAMKTYYEAVRGPCHYLEELHNIVCLYYSVYMNAPCCL